MTPDEMIRRLKLTVAVLAAVLGGACLAHACAAWAAG